MSDVREPTPQTGQGQAVVESGRNGPTCLSSPPTRPSREQAATDALTASRFIVERTLLGSRQCPTRRDQRKAGGRGRGEAACLFPERPEQPGSGCASPGQSVSLWMTTGVRSRFQRVGGRARAAPGERQACPKATRKDSGARRSCRGCRKARKSFLSRAPVSLIPGIPFS